MRFHALGSHDRSNRTVRSEGTANVNRAMEAHWVMVRPAMLTDGPHTGQYHTGAADVDLPDGQVSRADVAKFVFKQLNAER